MANYYYWQNNGVGAAGSPWGAVPARSELQQHDPQQHDPQQHDLQLKVLSSANKKDFRVYTLRGVRCDQISSPEKLKEIVLSQCGSEVVPPVDKMEIGYYHQCKKIWINNRLDLHDALGCISRAERLTLWCIGTSEQSRKRDTNDSSDEELEFTNKKPKKVSKQEDKRATVETYEQQLKEKHGGNYTRFQLKLWAEMLAVGTHSDFDEPPSASMFAKPHPKAKAIQNENSDKVVSGMMTVVNTLCQSVLSNQSNQHTIEKKSDLSLVKRAELRSMYMQQLTELRQLLANEIITNEEYEEQRSDLIKSMRHLRTE